MAETDDDQPLANRIGDKVRGEGVEMVGRFDVYLINLDENVQGPKNTRPAVVVSPDEMNRNIDSVIIAPLATTSSHYPTRPYRIPQRKTPRDPGPDPNRRQIKTC